MEIKAIKLISIDPEYFNLLSFSSAEPITAITMEVNLTPSGKEFENNFLPIVRLRDIDEPVCDKPSGYKDCKICQVA